MTDEHDEHDHDEHDHHGPDCPQCQAIIAQVKVLSGIAEWMEARIKDDFFERLGEEMAMRREQAFWDDFLRGIK